VYAIEVYVYYEDTDAAGIVYHANYLKFMERCRSDWLRSRGCDVLTLQRRQGVVFALRRAALDYLSPGRLCDVLTVSLEVAKLGKVTLDLKQSVKRENEVLCTADLRLACLDADSLKPKAVPENLRRLLSRPEA